VQKVHFSWLPNKCASWRALKMARKWSRCSSNDLLYIKMSSKYMMRTSLAQRWPCQPLLYQRCNHSIWGLALIHRKIRIHPSGFISDRGRMALSLLRWFPPPKLSKVGFFRGSHGRRPTTTRPLGPFFAASLPAGNSGGCPHHSHPLKQGSSSDTKWYIRLRRGWPRPNKLRLPGPQQFLCTPTRRKAQYP
jgi:hypothetical protein